jgi:ankyrin repeat protein
MWAVSQKHADVVKVLLSHGADLSIRSATWSQVMAVPPHGYMPYNREIPAGDETALLFAARVGDLDSARLLVAAGADVNDADAWGVSAVTMAAHSGFGSLVEFLLEKGADPNAMRAGFAARFHEAVMRRDETMVAALLAHGANAANAHRCRPGRRRGGRPTTGTSRPSSSAPRRSGWRRDSPRRTSCGCS